MAREDILVMSKYFVDSGNALLTLACSRFAHLFCSVIAPRIGWMAWTKSTGTIGDFSSRCVRFLGSNLDAKRCVLFGDHMMRTAVFDNPSLPVQRRLRGSESVSACVR
jgi:hypothetical protein